MAKPCICICTSSILYNICLLAYLRSYLLLLLTYFTYCIYSSYLITVVNHFLILLLSYKIVFLNIFYH
jgi:hypothetical protein